MICIVTAADPGGGEAIAPIVPP